MLSKRNYKLTPNGDVWKVEAWNDYGMKCTVYENNVMDASEVIMNWWENSEEEFDKMNKLNNAIHAAHQLDKENGVLTRNSDSLD
jgi:hypothetical protein